MGKASLKAAIEQRVEEILEIGDDNNRRDAYLLQALARIIEKSSVEEIHRAFGAPGDWGYGTPIGEALYSVYRGE